MSAYMPKRPTPSDRIIGARVREARLAARMTQKALAACLRLQFQQVQKYENGSSRISAGRLHDVALATRTPVLFFFRDLGPIAARATVARRAVDSRR